MGTESKDLKVDDALEAQVNNHIRKKRRSSPRPLSVFSKTFLVVLLAHAGILTALGLFVQQPVVLILAGLEAFVASLTLFGLRWIPVLGSSVGFLMLLVFTTATALPIHHLTHPKDAFGYDVFPALSFLMYMVMTGLFWCAAMLIVTGVPTVIHNYFFARWQNFPWFKTVLTGSICLWCGAVLVGALTEPERPINTLSPNTVALGVGSFSSSSISLSKGEKLTIVDSGPYHHSLSMGHWINGQPVLQNQSGAPSLTNKDVNAAGQTVMLGPFNTAGTFYLMCSLHHNMMLKIIVT